MESGGPALIVACFMALGLWLEGINGKHGWLDELLTPFPLGIAGCGTIVFERIMA